MCRRFRWPRRRCARCAAVSGGPARVIVNRLMRDLGRIDDDVPPFPLAAPAVAALRGAAERLGRGDFSPLWAGQNATGCKPVSATALTRELAEGCRRSG